MDRKKTMQVLMFAALNNRSDFETKIAELYPEITVQQFWINRARATSTANFVSDVNNFIFLDPARVRKINALAVKYNPNANNSTTNSEAQRIMAEKASNINKPASDWIMQVSEILTGSTNSNLQQNVETKSINPVVVIGILLVVAIAVYLIVKFA